VRIVLLPQMFVVRDAGHVMLIVTAEICVTFTLKEQVSELQALVTVQVTVVVPSENTLPLDGTQRLSAPPVTVGLAKVTTASLPQVVLVRRAGQVMFKGGAGATVTLKEQEFVPQALVAVQVTVLVPREKPLPLAGTQRMSAPPVTVGLGKVTSISSPSQVMFVDEAGQVSVMATAGICCTVTLKEQVLEPQALVAAQVTVFVPSGNTLPLIGTQPMSVPPETAGFT